MANEEKQPVLAGMKVRAYPVMLRAIEEGVAYGWRRAHKHTETPTPEAIQDEIAQQVINAVCEYFDFDPEQGD